MGKFEESSLKPLKYFVVERGGKQFVVARVPRNSGGSILFGPRAGATGKTRTTRRSTEDTPAVVVYDSLEQKARQSKQLERLAARSIQRYRRTLQDAATQAELISKFERMDVALNGLEGVAAASDEAATKAIVNKFADVLIEQGIDLQGVDDKSLFRSWLRAVPKKATSEDNLASRIGPFYDTQGLTNWLDISRQGLDKRVKAGKLLACRTAENVRVYPVWQFTESGSLLPGLEKVLEILKEGTDDGWTIGLWLVTKTQQLNRKSAIEWLQSGADPAPVLAAARRDATVWAA